MLRMLSASGLLLMLAGCALPVTPVTRPPEGYRAIRFERPFSTRILGQVTNFSVGSVYVQDRTRDADGAALWCTGSSEGYNCIALREGQIRIYAHVPATGEVWWDLPPGTISEIRLP